MMQLDPGLKMQRFPALVFGLLTVLIVLLNRSTVWTPAGRFILLFLLGMSVLGFLLSLFPRRGLKRSG